MLRGEARLGELLLGAGDYHLARSHSRHGQVSSASGALLFLRGTPLGHGGEVLRDLFTALLPGRGEAPLTLRAAEGEWQTRADGIQSRLLREDAHSCSQMLRLPPGFQIDAGSAPLGGECLLVEGDLSVDDWSMQPGDYQLARAGARHAELSSRQGALLFARSPS